MRRISVVSFCLAICFSLSFTQVRTNPGLHEFLIIIETTNNGFKLSSNDGCAWTELTFSAKPYSAHLINQYGMTEKDKLDSEVVDKLLFSISKTEKGVTLIGHEGTAWTKLEFSRTKQAVNQFGMTDL